MSEYYNFCRSQLVEISDEYGRTVCLLPLHEAQRQRLCFKIVAVLAHDDQQLMLKEYDSSLLGFTASGPALPNRSMAECAEALLAPTIPATIRIDLDNFHKMRHPALANAALYIARVHFSSKLLSAVLSDGFSLIDIAGLRNLAELGLLEPIFHAYAQEVSLLK